MKYIWIFLVLLTCLSCEPDSKNGASSNNTKETTQTTSEKDYDDQWAAFKSAVENENTEAILKFMQFPMGGDCLPGTILLSKPNAQITALDFATHGGKMLTPAFKKLVAESNIAKLLDSANADHRFDLSLHEKTKSFEGHVVEFSTIYQFQILGDRLKMVAIYCAG